MKIRSFVMLTFLWSSVALAQSDPMPIIDMHVSALPVQQLGGPGQTICLNGTTWMAANPGAPVESSADTFQCENPVTGVRTDTELRQQTLDQMREHNIIGVISGTLASLRAWRAAEPDRIIPALHSSLLDDRDATPASLQRLVRSGAIQVLGEVAPQFDGRSPADSAYEPFWSRAEELDIPVGIHMGPGPPAAPYVGYSEYRASLGRPLLLEDVLVAHPALRVYVMHAGWPFLDELLSLLYLHPQVYVDVSLINHQFPRAEFQGYLRLLVEAGFGKRIMFGSDQMVWPQAIPVAIAAIESAAFLSDEQKRDIFYNNAARFLRLSEDEIARHHELATP